MSSWNGCLGFGDLVSGIRFWSDGAESVEIGMDMVVVWYVHAEYIRIKVSMLVLGMLEIERRGLGALRVLSVGRRGVWYLVFGTPMVRIGLGRFE